METFGYILIAFGVGMILGAYLKIPHRELRSMSHTWTYGAQDDHQITVWELEPLYDWEERGEL